MEKRVNKHVFAGFSAFYLVSWVLIDSSEVRLVSEF